MRRTLASTALFLAIAINASLGQTPPRTPELPSEELAKMPQTPGAKGDQQRHYRFEEARQEMPYRLYVPPTYNPGTKMALILALHGAGGRQDYFFRSGRDTQDLCDKYGFIFVAPLGYHAFGGYGAMQMPRPQVPGQAPRTPDPRRPQWTPEEARHVNELSEKDALNVLALVEKEYNIDRSRVYLMGHSMGGFGTWYLGQKYASRWAGLAPMSGGFGYVEYPMDRIKGIPLIVSAGSQDIAIHGEAARAEVARFEAAGLKPVYVEIEGGTHMSMISPMLPRIFEFFATHHR